MYVDALTVAAIADELRQTIGGGRIQHVLLPTPLSVGLEVFRAGRRYQVLASANPRSARLHLVEGKLSRGVEREPPLLLLLRKYLRGGTITAVEQPELERIVVLSITKYAGGRKDDEDDEEETEDLHSELIIELIGQRANVILVDDNNLILEAVKHLPGDSGGRTISPRAAYTLPPQPPGRLDPRTATAGGVAEAWARGDPARGLTAVYSGVSPLVAREVLVRAEAQGRAADDDLFDAVAAELRALYLDPPTPSVAWQDDQPIAYAPYLMRQYPDVRPVASMSAALQLFYAAAEQVTSHAQRRDHLLERLRDAQTKFLRQREALERELERAQALDQLRWEGEMIYGYLHTITPGQTTLEVEGRTIRLDPAQTPSENAQARFRAYDKAKGAIVGVPERLQATEAQLAYFDETIALLELADSFEAISTIERELNDQGLLGRSGPRPKGPRAGPLRVTSSEGTPILVGRSAGQNDEVTFTLARPDDIWLHARGVPGAHVIIRSDTPPGDATLLEAAGLAAHFSMSRGSTAVEVSLCARRNVRKVAGGPPGLVTIRNERTLRVRPVAPADLVAPR
jgi:predicted ribosome quality control (RQC) complex YloA/Tae2 family protein